MSVWAGRSETTVNAVWRLLVRLAIIAALVYACYRLRTIIATLFVAAIFAYSLDPMVEWMTRRPRFIRFHYWLASLNARLFQWYRRTFYRAYHGEDPEPKSPVRIRQHVLRVYATLYVFVLAVAVLWYGGKIVATPFVTEIRAASSAEGQRKWKENIDKGIAIYNQNVPEWLQSSELQKTLATSDLPKLLQTFAVEIGAKVVEGLKNIVEIVLLPVLAFYFIIDGHKLKREFVALVPRSRIRETLLMVNEFNRIMRAYVVGQFILCALAGIVVGSGLALLKVQYSIILGVLAGVTRAIPVIGPIIGGIPIVLLTLIDKGVPTALAVLGFFTFLHFAESKFIMPLLLGDRMELHPVIIIVVLLVGGNLGGLLIGGWVGALLGMFFAAPIASLIRVMVRRYWLCIRTRPPKNPETRQPEIAAAEARPAALPEAAN